VRLTSGALKRVAGRRCHRIATVLLQQVRMDITYRNRTLLLVGALCAAIAPAGRSFADGEETSVSVTGELFYMQRIALPDDAEAIVELRAIDARDGESAPGEQRIRLQGRQVPVRFGFEVPLSRLDPALGYAVRGAIRVGGETQWLTDPVEVDPFSGAIDVGEVLLRPYQAAAQEDAGAATLEGAEWRVTGLDGTEPVAGSSVTLTFDGAGTVAGSTGCNRFRGSYEASDGTLSIGQAAATMMACSEPLMQQERRFLDLLATIARYEIAPDGTLLMTSDDGRSISAARG
jgi:heat shock protein HslJ